MLTEMQLTRILGPAAAGISVDDIHWQTQASTATSILFYYLNQNPEAETLFLERIQSAHYACVVVNRALAGLPARTIVIDDANWLPTQKAVLDVLYPLPGLKLMAVTGTNGKTTTTDLVLQLGELAGLRGLSLGTLGLRDKNGLIKDFGLTSPSFIDLRKALALYGGDKDFCMLEASSHALGQGRLFEILFDAAGWTSFSQDHLDYHSDMQAYFDAKCLLLNHLRPAASLFIPRRQQQLFEEVSARSNQVRRAAEIYAELPLFFKTPFNRDNLELAVAMLEEVFKLKVPPAFDQLVAPDGRFYIRSFGTNYIIVDFAHTPDALDNICQAIRESFPGHKLKVLFGCGGDRDRKKRPLMGAVAEKWAEVLYLTSDNPRSEDPERIIQDIQQGLQRQHPAITDRRAAVQRAFSELSGHEVLLLAGKGHEDYILIKGVKHPYSDIQEVDAFLAKESP
jgi:UDP-N-acetylmuramoyl-L-alanyl-D-glutamate--2,6-diaminopimelate ligase